LTEQDHTVFAAGEGLLGRDTSPVASPKMRLWGRYGVANQTSPRENGVDAMESGTAGGLLLSDDENLPMAISPMMSLKKTLQWDPTAGDTELNKDGIGVSAGKLKLTGRLIEPMDVKGNTDATEQANRQKEMMPLIGEGIPNLLEFFQKQQQDTTMSMVSGSMGGSLVIGKQQNMLNDATKFGEIASVTGGVDLNEEAPNLLNPTGTAIPIQNPLKWQFGNATFGGLLDDITKDPNAVEEEVEQGFSVKNFIQDVSSLFKAEIMKQFGGGTAEAPVELNEVSAQHLKNNAGDLGESRPKDAGQQGPVTIKPNELYSSMYSDERLGSKDSELTIGDDDDQVIVIGARTDNKAVDSVGKNAGPMQQQQLINTAGSTAEQENDQNASTAIVPAAADTNINGSIQFAPRDAPKGSPRRLSTSNFQVLQARFSTVEQNNIQFVTDVENSEYVAWDAKTNDFLPPPNYDFFGNAFQSYSTLSKYNLQMDTNHVAPGNPNMRNMMNGNMNNNNAIDGTNLQGTNAVPSIIQAPEKTISIDDIGEGDPNYYQGFKFFVGMDGNVIESESDQEYKKFNWNKLFRFKGIQMPNIIPAKISSALGGVGVVGENQNSIAEKTENAVGSPNAAGSPAAQPIVPDINSNPANLLNTGGNDHRHVVNSAQKSPIETSYDPATKNQQANSTPAGANATNSANSGTVINNNANSSKFVNNMVNSTTTGTNLKSGNIVNVNTIESEEDDHHLAVAATGVSKSQNANTEEESTFNLYSNLVASPFANPNKYKVEDHDANGAPSFSHTVAKEEEQHHDDGENINVTVIESPMPQSSKIGTNATTATGNVTATAAPIRSELLNFNVTEIKQPKMMMSNVQTEDDEQLEDQNVTTIVNKNSTNRSNANSKELQSNTNKALPFDKSYTEHYIDTNTGKETDILVLDDDVLGGFRKNKKFLEGDHNAAVPMDSEDYAEESTEEIEQNCSQSGVLSNPLAAPNCSIGNSKSSDLNFVPAIQVVSETMVREYSFDSDTGAIDEKINVNDGPGEQVSEQVPTVSENISNTDVKIVSTTAGEDITIENCSEDTRTNDVTLPVDEVTGEKAEKNVTVDEVTVPVEAAVFVEQQEESLQNAPENLVRSESSDKETLQNLPTGTAIIAPSVNTRSAVLLLEEENDASRPGDSQQLENIDSSSSKKTVIRGDGNVAANDSTKMLLKDDHGVRADENDLTLESPSANTIGSSKRKAIDDHNKHGPQRVDTRQQNDFHHDEMKSGQSTANEKIVYIEKGRGGKGSGKHGGKYNTYSKDDSDVKGVVTFENPACVRKSFRKSSQQQQEYEIQQQQQHQLVKEDFVRKSFRVEESAADKGVVKGGNLQHQQQHQLVKEDFVRKSFRKENANTMVKEHNEQQQQQLFREDRRKSSLSMLQRNYNFGQEPLDEDKMEMMSNYSYMNSDYNVSQSGPQQHQSSEVIPEHMNREQRQQQHQEQHEQREQYDYDGNVITNLQVAQNNNLNLNHYNNGNRTGNDFNNNYNPNWPDDPDPHEISARHHNENTMRTAPQFVNTLAGNMTQQNTGSTNNHDLNIIDGHKQGDKRKVMMMSSDNNMIVKNSTIIIRHEYNSNNERISSPGANQNSMNSPSPSTRARKLEQSKNNDTSMINVLPSMQGIVQQSQQSTKSTMTQNEQHNNGSTNIQQSPMRHKQEILFPEYQRSYSRDEDTTGPVVTGGRSESPSYFDFMKQNFRDGADSFLIYSTNCTDKTDSKTEVQRCNDDGSTPVLQESAAVANNGNGNSLSSQQQQRGYGAATQANTATTAIASNSNPKSPNRAFLQSDNRDIITTRDNKDTNSNNVNCKLQIMLEQPFGGSYDSSKMNSSICTPNVANPNSRPQSRDCTFQHFKDGGSSATLNLPGSKPGSGQQARTHSSARNSFRNLDCKLQFLVNPLSSTDSMFTLDSGVECIYDVMPGSQGTMGSAGGMDGLLLPVEEDGSSFNYNVDTNVTDANAIHDVQLETDNRGEMCYNDHKNLKSDGFVVLPAAERQKLMVEAQLNSGSGKVDSPSVRAKTGSPIRNLHLKNDDKPQIRSSFAFGQTSAVDKEHGQTQARSSFPGRTMMNYGQKQQHHDQSQKTTSNVNATTINNNKTIGRDDPNEFSAVPVTSTDDHDNKTTDAVTASLGNFCDRLEEQLQNRGIGSSGKTTDHLVSKSYNQNGDHASHGQRGFHEEPLLLSNYNFATGVKSHDSPFSKKPDHVIKGNGIVVGGSNGGSEYNFNNKQDAKNITNHFYDHSQSEQKQQQQQQQQQHYQPLQDVNLHCNFITKSDTVVHLEKKFTEKTTFLEDRDAGNSGNAGKKDKACGNVDIGATSSWHLEDVQKHASEKTTHITSSPFRISCDDDFCKGMHTAASAMENNNNGSHYHTTESFETNNTLPKSISRSELSKKLRAERKMFLASKKSRERKKFAKKHQQHKGTHVEKTNPKSNLSTTLKPSLSNTSLVSFASSKCSSSKISRGSSVAAARMKMRMNITKKRREIL